LLAVVALAVPIPARIAALDGLDQILTLVRSGRDPETAIGS
jgi:hypothetical protein